MHADAGALVVVLAAQRVRVDGGCRLLHGAHVIDVLATRRDEVGVFEFQHATGLALRALEAAPRIVDQRANGFARTDLRPDANHVDVRDHVPVVGGVEALAPTEQLEPLGAERVARPLRTPGSLLLRADGPYPEPRHQT
jgi:hypothetical protein